MALDDDGDGEDVPDLEAEELVELPREGGGAADHVDGRLLPSRVNESRDPVDGAHLLSDDGLGEIAGRDDHRQLVAGAVVLLRDRVVEEEDADPGGDELERPVDEGDQESLGRDAARLVEKTMPLHVAREKLRGDHPRRRRHAVRF